MYNLAIVLFAGPVVALFNLFWMIYRCILFLLLIYVIIKLIRKSYKKAIVTGVLFFILAIPATCFICNNYIVKKEASVQFLGDYTLNRLDGEDCVNCRVRLHNNYRYDIYVGEEIVGHGKWDITTAYDIPHWLLKIENGVRGRDRCIEIINRPE